MANSESTQNEAINRLHEWGVKPGDTVYTILRHVSASGMSRSIDLLVFQDSQPVELSYWASRAMQDKIDPRYGGIKISGAGMDMGFALVYNLGRIMFRAGFGCIGEGCPSNDHSNGDHDYTPHMNGASTTFEPGYVAHWHNDGGYALKQRWL